MSLQDDLEKSLAERRRLHILEFLRDRPGYRAETSDIQTHLAEVRLSVVSTSKLVGDLVKLRDLDLLILIGDGLGAKITATGVEVANGAIQCPGVARPRPE